MMNKLVIAERIKSRREQCNLTLKEVAAKVGIASSTVLRYEKAQIERIKLPVVHQIAKALDADPAWLSGMTDTFSCYSVDPQNPDQFESNDYEEWLSSLSQDELLQVIAKATQALQERSNNG